MHTVKQRIIFAAAIVSLLIVGVVPVSAADFSVPAATAPSAALPPLPEWPIIGPILRRLGLVREVPDSAPAPLPDRDLPEYRITELEDLDKLAGIEPYESVRVIASEEDLNRMVQEVLDDSVGGSAGVAMDFETDQVTLRMTANTALLEKSGLDIPVSIRGDLNILTTVSAGIAGCRPTIKILALKVNRWSIGLRPIAQRALDARLPEVWPAEVCVERIVLMTDGIAVEGSRLQ